MCTNIINCNLVFLLLFRVYELDLDKKKKQAKMHAKQYIDTVMMNIQKQLGDEQIFPTKFGQYNISTSLVNVSINLSIHPFYMYLSIHCTSIYSSLWIHLLLVFFLLGYDFPYDFVQIVRKVFRQFYIILAHIYFHHFLDFKRLQLHDGLNTLFLHFAYFVSEFSLVDPKDLSLLDDLIEKLKSYEDTLAQQPKNVESEFNMVASRSS